MGARAGAKLAKNISKRVSPKANSKKTRVVPIQTHALADLVSTIGYQTPNVLAATKIKAPKNKETQEYLKERLGGKGAGLVSIAKLGISVPPAFNLSTALCSVYLSKQRIPDAVIQQCHSAMTGLEKALNKKFGSAENPLLVSVRSGARISMPGMMDTILNLGLNTAVTENLAKKYPDRARFFWDCYRRLIQMFSGVVLNLDLNPFEDILADIKDKEGVRVDSELSEKAVQKVCEEYLAHIRASSKTFPQDPWEQLTLAMEAVFRSWNTDRAIHYRKLNRISDEWGTSVTVQAMVFGNLNDRSGTGVVFTRDPSTGVNKLYGEYLLNAQGEDVVAGIRTPHEIHEMKKQLPKSFVALVEALEVLEKHFNEVQDVEFTVEEEKLYILQTRSAKRTASAALEHAAQFVKEKRLNTKEALKRISYDQVKQLLHPTLKATTEKPVAKGLPASPGAVSGRVVFDPETAVLRARTGIKVILVRRETSPEDIMGMAVAEGILTATGGMTSHAAVVGRGMGKSCVVGCTELHVNEQKKFAEVRGVQIQEEDWITLNGSTGEVYLGDLPTAPVTWGETAKTFFSWADAQAKIPVLANADTPEQAKLSVGLGAQGIGLCRTEHMFFDKERIKKFRLMILTEDTEMRSSLAQELQRYQREDFIGILKEMAGLSVCVRLLDPPLHEFLPKADDLEEIRSLAVDLKVSENKLVNRIHQLHETNPMLGHRGCRLGVTFPEIYSMQVRALAESLAESLKNSWKAELKIMIPLVMNTQELAALLKTLKADFETQLQKSLKSDAGLMKAAQKFVKWGTMIELPRACVVAKDLAPLIDFFSFGTNDLTQTTLGISRDDAAKFVPTYREQGLMSSDPFETLDQEGVGRLIRMAVEEGRKANSKLEIGVCGEHGGDPESIRFFHSLQFNTVSCSPFRVPIARLAVARVEEAKKK
ncbi:MAG: pyruvate, phosphate dikinase [Deltaproteobacteria bacterium]|nr:pyruvate, phosphate dikinase [Deltaproteobacteria bacterium]